MDASNTELAGVRALDPQAITAIHNRYYPDIYRFARYRLGDDDVAEDIAAEVFLNLLEAIHAGRGPATSLRGWLFSTAANLVNDHYRKKYSRPTEAIPENLDEMQHPPDKIIDTEALFDSNERNSLVRAAINELTEEQKQVIALRFGSDYSLEETASVMGKQVNAIKALQFRALGAIRRRIGEQTI